MNNQEDKKNSAEEEQPRGDEGVHAEPGEASNENPPATKEPGGIDAEVVLMDRPPRSGRIEIKGPPGMAVSVAGNEWFTKIVIRLPIHDEGAWTP